MVTLDNFYLQQTEPNQSCLLALRKIILEQDRLVSETVKYGMPCFCFKGKMFCYLWIDKRSDMPYILFVEGNKLNHPELISGNRARMKTFTVNPNVDLPINTVNTLLHEALDLYRKDIVKIK